MIKKITDHLKLKKLYPVKLKMNLMIYNIFSHLLKIKNQQKLLILIKKNYI